MKVKELIKELETYSDRLDVCIENKYVNRLDIGRNNGRPVVNIIAET